MSTSTYAVKVVLDEDIRKVRLPTDIADAATTIGATFAISDPALIQIFWRGKLKAFVSYLLKLVSKNWVVPFSHTHSS